ncbi:MAG: phosphopantothenate/pantothenate synthetase [Candidatus Thermoplasmatota archaeon]|nr:phosphopantothenate/pantothenate synthetase [Candidatus Thermoplasmatota archaeon]MBU1941993.1 phosphopantothenate/pantothenate synthetase [Candidatus Thermoplasmatota archaeon]
MTHIPKSHPRYQSLMLRELISSGMKNGLVHETGLIAHGRGEAFDYLLGEDTPSIADEACKIAAAQLVLANDPVLSVNGNVAALVAQDCVKLGQVVPAKLEVNLFHRSAERMNLICDVLKNAGAASVYGIHGDARIAGLDHNRGICDKNGIYGSDVVLVPLEDGDRCAALKKMGKIVITIDLNPLSRTARTADITIVDNVVRALPRMVKYVQDMKQQDKETLKNMAMLWDNMDNLRKMLGVISDRLHTLF